MLLILLWKALRKACDVEMMDELQASPDYDGTLAPHSDVHVCIYIVGSSRAYVCAGAEAATPLS